MVSNDKTVYDPGATVPENGCTVYEGDQTVPESAGTVPDGGTTLAEAALSDAAARGAEAVPAENAAIVKGETILGTYTVQSDAIQGGMGSVWRVHHKNWNVDLAMKRPQPKCFSTEKSKADFIRECEAWINLGLHPNIVSCYYVREISGVPTIFSEWMDGGSLESAIKKGTLYEGSEAKQQKRILDIAIQFARGLHYAHECRDADGNPRGLIHQDVKPDNLLLTRDGEAKVADFGLAKARAVLTLMEGEPAMSEAPGSSKTIVSPSGGYTPAYCSMEQMDGKELTRRTDIYSWAVSVMEMYMGSRPWDKGPYATGPLAGLGCRGYFESARVPMPETLKDLLAQCMAAEPDDRPHDFSEVEEKLHEIYKAETGKDYPRPAPKAAADTADSLNNRALSYLDLGKKEEGKECWNAALIKEPSNVTVCYNHELYLKRMDAKHYDENSILDVINRMGELNQGTPSAQGHYLAGLLELERYGGAWTEFDEAAKLAYDDTDMRARCERMREIAKKGFIRLPVGVSERMPFDVSPDEKRCAIATTSNINGDEVECQILLFDMESRSLNARQTIDFEPRTVVFANGRLYVCGVCDLTAWDEHTLMLLPCEKDEYEPPEEPPYMVYDGLREVTKPKLITAIRFDKMHAYTTQKWTEPELVRVGTQRNLIDTYVRRFRGMDRRGIYLHIQSTYGPFAPKDEITLFDARVYGHLADYALCRVHTTKETMMREEKLANLMRDARAAYDDGDCNAALTALDQAYSLMNGSPTEEWESLNNAVGCHGRRVALRGWRVGTERGKGELIRGITDEDKDIKVSVELTGGRTKSKISSRDDKGRMQVIAYEPTATIRNDDIAAFDRRHGVLFTAGNSGMLYAWTVSNNTCKLKHSARIGPPLPNGEDEHAALRPFFCFNKPDLDYVILPRTLALNADGTAVLLLAEICNPYAEDDDYSNAVRLMLVNTETLQVIRRVNLTMEWMSRDFVESNKAPFQGASFSPDGRTLLLRMESGAELWFYPDLTACQVVDLINQRPCRFREDGNSYLDSNQDCEIILDWKYEV